MKGCAWGETEVATFKTCRWVIAATALMPLGTAAQSPAPSGPVYPTYGVHNPANDSPCANPTCIYPRRPGEPSNPVYPPYWQSSWTMFRVFQGYQNNPPPYRGRPPVDLVPGRDYQVTFGATYYDSTWRGASGEGAMMEHYEHFCLPIIRQATNFTCSFISLGNTAFFVTYPQDRPAGMPPVCLFSPLNHPPRRDFIKHLPYAASDSARLGQGGQAYSFWVALSSGQPMQVGASPDQTGTGILFGYAFAPVNGQLQPQSFYFSGNAGPPANAPIVSQNYWGWSATRPDPARTWNQVSGLNPATLPACQIMTQPSSAMLAASATQGQRLMPTWSDIGRWPPR